MSSASTSSSVWTSASGRGAVPRPAPRVKWSLVRAPAQDHIARNASLQGTASLTADEDAALERWLARYAERDARVEAGEDSGSECSFGESSSSSGQSDGAPAGLDAQEAGLVQQAGTHITKKSRSSRRSALESVDSRLQSMIMAGQASVAPGAPPRSLRTMPFFMTALDDDVLSLASAPAGAASGLTRPIGRMPAIAESGGAHKHEDDSDDDVHSVASSKYSSRQLPRAADPTVAAQRHERMLRMKLTMLEAAIDSVRHTALGPPELDSEAPLLDGQHAMASLDALPTGDTRSVAPSIVQSLARSVRSSASQSTAAARSVVSHATAARGVTKGDIAVELARAREQVRAGAVASSDAILAVLQEARATLLHSPCSAAAQAWEGTGRHEQPDTTARVQRPKWRLPARAAPANVPQAATEHARVAPVALGTRSGLATADDIPSDDDAVPDSAELIAELAANLAGVPRARFAPPESDSPTRASAVAGDSASDAGDDVRELLHLLAHSRLSRAHMAEAIAEAGMLAPEQQELRSLALARDAQSDAMAQSLAAVQPTDYAVAMALQELEDLSHRAPEFDTKLDDDEDDTDDDMFDAPGAAAAVAAPATHK